MATLFGYRLEGPGPDYVPYYVGGIVQADGTVAPYAGGYLAAGSVVLPPTQGSRDPFLHPFAVDAPFNLAISTGATFEADNSTKNAFWIGKGNAAAGGGIAQVNDQGTGYSVAVAKATTSDPVVTITHPNTGAVLIPSSAGFRIPANFTPPTPPGGELGDRNSVIIQPDGTGYDLYRLIRQSSTSYTSTSADAINILGSGIVRGVRAANIALLNGLIRKHEIQALNIPHAVAVSIPETALGPASPGFVWPANARDSSLISYSGPIPMGTLLAIPSTVNVNTLPLSPEGLALAKALQNYGAYIIDRSSTYALYLEPNSDGTPAPSWLNTAATNIKNDWRDDLMKLLRVVSNNSASTPGGGAIGSARLAPDAAPLA